MAVGVLEAFAAGTDGESPDWAELFSAVEEFCSLVVEGELCVFVPDRPNQGLMAVVEAWTSEVRGWVSLVPNDVVDYPEAKTLHDWAENVDALHWADDPDWGGRFEESSALSEPISGEGFIICEWGEFVPIVVAAVKLCAFYSVEDTASLHEVGRVSEYEVNRFWVKFGHFVNGLSVDDYVMHD